MKRALYIFLSSSLLITLLSCEQFVEIDPPVSDLVRTTVFKSDETAERAVLGIYSQMATGTGFASGAARSITFTGSLSSDELINYSTTFRELGQFDRNVLLSSNATILQLWSDLYQTIYRVNAVIEGLTSGNSSVSEELRMRLIGEAKFIRAFCHFYLVNLWGDIPLVLSTDYRINSNISRTDKSTVYVQIIEDLNQAKASLPNLDASRLRVSKEAATAMLSRVYLFIQDWSNAELQASEVIDTKLELEPDLGNVFLTTSKEAIWQLARNNANSPEGQVFIFANTPTNGALRQSLIDSFDSDDLRRTNWVGSRIVDENEFFFPYKYKASANNPVTEYSMVIRLAEFYLIRAEARAQRNVLEDAKEDLNVIRNRAGLTNTIAMTREEILASIEQERKVELFAEWGHRWLDLKRTNRANEILPTIKSEWVPTAILYPIPDIQLLNNKAMTNAQNPGY